MARRGQYLRQMEAVMIRYRLKRHRGEWRGRIRQVSAGIERLEQVFCPRINIATELIGPGTVKKVWLLEHKTEFLLLDICPVSG